MRSFGDTASQNIDDPTFLTRSLSVSPAKVLSEFFVGNFELEIGNFDDALYVNDVVEVACTKNLICNKKISNTVQEWSAGRPGNRPIGAGDAPRNSHKCLGPYATRNCQ